MTGRLPAALTGALVVVMVAQVWAPAPSTASGAHHAKASSADRDGRLLDAPAHGRAALTRLGEGLGVAAARNQMTSSRLAGLLASDSTAWLDPTGRLYYVEPTPTASAKTGTSDAAAYPLNQTFSLHSDPGATKTIYLDFNGQRVAGSIWNRNSSLPDGFYGAWTIDGDASTFNEAERTAIQSIWQRVAEDYAPFDIDVTTEDPGSEALTRSSFSDPTYGTRALITQSAAARSAVCGGSCGGVAYVGTFDATSSTLDYVQPAWIFPQGLGPNNAKFMAEAVSHEVGHTFGLSHDGTSSQGYYTGQGSWAPIMGVGYGEPITQFSRGEYANANNQQDDLAVIRDNGVVNRADEAGGEPGSAAELTSGTVTGFITDAADRDTFAVDRSCATTFTASAAPTSTSPNLDIQLSVLDANAKVVRASDPASGGSADTSTGMAASLDDIAGPGVVYLRIDGVGHGNPATSGYSDYGSLGRYTLHLSNVCVDQPPAAPRRVSTTRGNSRVTLAWSPPSNATETGVSSYLLRMYSDQGVQLGARQVRPRARSYTWEGLKNGTPYTFDIAAKTPSQTGRKVTLDSIAPARTPWRPGIGAASKDRFASGSTARVTWNAPRFDGGDPLKAYVVKALRVTASGVIRQRVVSGSLPATQQSYTVQLPRAGRWEFVVRAVNGIGVSKRSAPSNVIRAG